MSTRPLLTPIDPSSSSSMMPARSPSPSSSSSSSSAGSGDDSAPATPSKDKMREWTFPRNGGVASTSSSTGGARNEVDGIHGRSSSVAPSSAGGHASNGRIQSPSSAKGGEGAASLDLRHRSNASLAFAPSSSLSPPSTTLSLPRLLSSSPSSNSSPNRNPNLAKLVYSNIRRRSAHDLLFILIFGGAFLLFARALAGAGYDATREKSLAVGEGAEVKLPPGFLPHEQGEYLEEVHQRHGDSSHDVGEDLLRDSPEDVHLEEAHAHDADEVYAYPPSDPPADADEDEPLAAADDGPSSPSSSDDGERESEEDGPQIVRLSSTSSSSDDDSLEEEDPLDLHHSDEEEEDDSLVITREEAEREDPEALDENAEIDIEPTFDPSPPSSLDSPSEDEPEELTALEELLDSASLEAETGELSLLELPLEEEEEEKRGLERAGRGREALRGKGKGARGKARGGRRMERRVRR